MANYKSMYFQMFNTVTQAINILQDAQKRIEEDYINSDEQDIVKLLSSVNMSNKNILDNIKKEPRKKTGEIKTLYLSVDVAEALKEVSAEKGISESKIVNEVLRQVLLP